MAEMKRSSRLERLAALTRLKEDAAARQLQKARQSLTRQNAQLDQLEQYREEYESNQPESTSVSMIQNYRDFCSSLGDAIEHQSRRCEAESARVADALGEWRGRHQRTEAISSAASSSRDQERVIDERRQNAIVDDIVTTRNIDRS